MEEKMKNLSPTPSPEGRGGEERRGGNESSNGVGFEGALYQRYARRLQGFFLRQLGHDAQAAADATHDTFLRAFEAMSREAPALSESSSSKAPSPWERAGGEVAPWLFTIAYNLLRNRYRHQAYEAEFLATLDRQPMDTADIELRLDRQTLLTALKKVLDELPPPLRLLFSLHYEEELTVPQVAAILQVPEGTVKSRLHKTMTIIRKKIKEYEK